MNEGIAKCKILIGLNFTYRSPTLIKIVIIELNFLGDTQLEERAAIKSADRSKRICNACLLPEDTQLDPNRSLCF